MPELMIEDDRNLLAGEYVLGTLDADEITRVNDLLDQDPQFRQLVSAWERRLGELHLMVEPVEPSPEIWQRIKARLAADVTPSIAAPETLPEPLVAAQEPLVPSQPEEIVKSEETSEAEPAGTGPAAEPKFTQVPSGPPFPNLPPQAGEGREGVEHVAAALPAAAAAEKETVPAEEPIAVAKEETAPTSEETIVAKQEPELVAFQPPGPEPLPEPEPLPKPAPPTEQSPALRLDIAPHAAGERQKAAPEPNRKEPLPRSGIGGWRVVAAVATLIAVGLASLIASWRYVPERLPPPLRPSVLLNMPAQPENPAKRPPLPEAQFQE
jgi:anti-sigma-K factor RskA